MRHERPADAHNIAYEIDTDYLDGPACHCPMCRPHGNLVAFVSRDDLTLARTATHTPAHRFNRQRLTHTFCSTPEFVDATGHVPNLGAPNLGDYGLTLNSRTRDKTA